MKSTEMPVGGGHYTHACYSILPYQCYYMVNQRTDPSLAHTKVYESLACKNGNGYRRLYVSKPVRVLVWRWLVSCCGGALCLVVVVV